MEQPYLGIFIVALLVLVLSLNFLTLRRLYYYFKNYLYEINEFIQLNNLSLIEIRNPNKTDWLNNPFRTRNSMFIELALPFSLLTHYTFIVQSINGEFEQYWLRMSCPLIGNKKIAFKKAGNKTMQFENGKSVKSNVEFVTNKCPACDHKIDSDIKNCIGCGLTFH
ncbi:hypothetical protein [uncultured Maribacter sp.]|uniref:hypothetical protein n=1 Tax=uncultured Maribacter sp. TaxID=431308 RepID=UPI00262DF00B|nr:hypothetical protein [uncultured Maribacter sp.]